MGVKKSGKVTFYRAESSSSQAYCETLENLLLTFMSSEERSSGSFDKGNKEYAWKVEEQFEILGTNGFLVSIVKEKAALPLWVKEDGSVDEPELTEGFLGDATYSIIIPSKNLISICSLGGGNNAVSSFLNEYSLDGKVQILPILDEKADEKVYNWDYFESMKLAFKFENLDSLDEAMATPFGKYLEILDEIGGLNININISSKSDVKETLNTPSIKDFLEKLSDNPVCTKFALKGASYSNPNKEEVDIKNAVVKYSGSIETEKNYIDSEVAKSFILTAMENKLELITYA